MIKLIPLLMLMLAAGCTSSGNAAANSDNAGNSEANVKTDIPTFNADSAYEYLKHQVEFGPRVPNTTAHTLCGNWLADRLRALGAEVTEQKADLKAFDGTVLHARNIFGRFNPEREDRVLLLAHWDCRPWADADPDPSRHTTPVEGANDGASGVAVILEAARNIALKSPDAGIDVLFVDAEDWGTEGDDESWALGARYFTENPPVENYMPEKAILLDMVGGKNAVFPREYFSQLNAPALTGSFWDAAERAGYGHLFPNQIGSAVTDDHIQLQQAGINAIDVIDYRVEEGFCPTWHTTSDNLENISRETLKAVGQTLLQYLYQ